MHFGMGVPTMTGNCRIVIFLQTELNSSEESILELHYRIGCEDCMFSERMEVLFVKPTICGMSVQTEDR